MSDFGDNKEPRYPLPQEAPRENLGGIPYLRQCQPKGLRAFQELGSRIIGEEPPVSLSQPVGKPSRILQEAAPGIEAECVGFPGVRTGWKPAGQRRFGTERSALRRPGEISGGLVYWFADAEFFLRLKASAGNEAI
jgi:hypothetical protein